MAVRVTWYGHAAFLIESDGKRILIDPFLSGNPVAPLKAEEVEADVILITHGHADHVGDAVDIARRTGALVISNYEIVSWFQNKGIQNTHPLHIGGGRDFDFGRVKLTPAFHGSILPDGSYGGNPAGVLLYLGKHRIYHAGDTGLFGDMKLIGAEKLDLAMLPIGDNFTMGPADALQAARLLKPKVVIPMHYNTWDLIQQDPHAWARKARAAVKGMKVVVLEPGGTFELK
ncbi:metal-dependent hydrolase [Thermoflexus sp.]|uniref:metal-dependent hydrolase n=1 Tax=Thermoflexus sp. TaxID=1969742 RepID=UPI0025F78697|nr:metal-dependent hydrolase [Thermoflexus sp.]MCS7352386.1 metal-dependent hydrolase [Thermoflexus sp.]MCX7689979.1 metal-dependent hydrolase [Thermoflexus sp.]MDW8181852.1 metal-dependent hydrolase [Anaerolineae bacterium]MDW8186092.1 metal-dependent hydrolase [Anaerolineae bacterium]